MNLSSAFNRYLAIPVVHMLCEQKTSSTEYQSIIVRLFYNFHHEIILSSYPLSNEKSSLLPLIYHHYFYDSSGHHLEAKIVITQIEDMRGKRETNSLTLLVTYLFLFIDVIQLYRTGSFSWENPSGRAKASIIGQQHLRRKNSNLIEYVKKKLLAGFEDMLGHLVGWKIDHILCILKTIKNEDTFTAGLQKPSIFVKKSDQEFL